MRSLIKRFHWDEQGATATEYAMLIVFVAVAIAAGANLLGTGISNMFSQIATDIKGITLPTLP